jgi:twitching motility protein PilT
MNISELLAIVVQHKASDLHLSAGMPPMMRVHGDVCDMQLPCLEHEQIQALISSTMNEAQKQEYRQRLECDYAFEIPDLARFRINAYQQQRGAGAVFRTIPTRILSLPELKAPSLFAELSMSPRGLILVTGPTGSGKSTTLAAMLDHRNNQDPGHILTIEDPIEFTHTSKRSLVNQREIHSHTLSFENALRSALREDPAVILVGELRDLETIRLALTAAETGHLVLATLHTSSAAKTIDRLIDVFPAAEKDMVRAMLSESLIAVITQTLCKTSDGKGRVAAHEIMLGTAAIRNLIRENKVAQMYSTIQTSQALGMQTLDQCLEKLVKGGQIRIEEARTHARFPEKFI